MKVEYTKCDICLKEIQEPHPIRLLVHKYVPRFRANPDAGSVYKKDKQFDICSDCESKLANILNQWESNDANG